MSVVKHIFISSKMEELKQERKFLKKFIPTLSRNGVELKAWIFEEDANSSNNSIQFQFLEALRDADLYIGLFWKLYGAWTIDEFKYATNNRFDRHIYEKRVDEIDSNGVLDREANLQKFLNEISSVSSGLSIKRFRTNEELELFVQKSIEAWLQDITLSRPGSTNAVFATHPDNITRRPRKFVGRSDLIQQLESLIKINEHILLQGFGGMGKTALAAELAGRCIENGLGSCLWLQVGDQSTNSIFEALAKPFNAHQEMAQLDEEHKVQLLGNLLRGHKIKLVVLDDVWNDQALFQVTPAIPRNAALIATSRTRYAISQIIEIRELTRPESLQLLSIHANKDLNRDDAADKICQKLGDNAFAIRLAGSTLLTNQLTTSALLNYLEETPIPLLEAPHQSSESQQENIASILKISLNKLQMIEPIGKTAYQTFLSFGAFLAPNASAELIALYLQEDRLTIERALAELKYRGLVEEIPKTESSINYFSVHDLAYSYANQKTNDQQKEKAVDSYLSYAKLYSTPNRDNFAALRPELESLLLAAKSAFTAKRYADVEQFVGNLFVGRRILETEGFYSQATELMNLAIQAAELRNDQQNVAEHLNNLGYAYFIIGNFTEAIEHISKSLALSTKLRNQTLQGKCLGNLGRIYRNQGEIKKAISHYSKAITIATQSDNLKQASVQLTSLGTVYYDTAEFTKAIDCYQRSLTIALRFGESERDTEANQYTCLAHIYAHLGQYKKASNYFNKCIAITKQTRAARIEGYALWGLGKVYLAKRNYSDAINLFNLSLNIAINTQDFDRQNRETLLSHAYLYANNLEESRKFAHEACQHDYPRTKHSARLIYGIVSARLGDIQKAYDLFEEAILAANNLLHITPKFYTAKYTRSAAYSCLALLSASENESNQRLQEAHQSYTQALRNAHTTGVIGDAIQLLEQIRVFDSSKKLEPIFKMLRKAQKDSK